MKKRSTKNAFKISPEKEQPLKDVNQNPSKKIEEPLLKRTINLAKKIFVNVYSVIAILTTVIGLLVLVPAVEIKTIDNIIPSEPFLALFKFQNKSLLPIYDVQTYAQMDSALANFAGTNTPAIEWRPHERQALKQDDTFSIEPKINPSSIWTTQFPALNGIGGIELIYAEMHLKVKYKYLFYPCEDIFHVVVWKQGRNEMRWVEQP